MSGYNTRSRSKKQNFSSAEDINNPSALFTGRSLSLSESDLHDFNEESISDDHSDDLNKTINESSECDNRSDDLDKTLNDFSEESSSNNDPNTTIRDNRDTDDEIIPLDLTLNQIDSIRDTLENNHNRENHNQAIPTLDKEFALRFIPEFNGGREKLQKFIKCCERMYNESYSQADSDMLLSIIESKITDLADNVIKYANYSNWPDLKKILLEKFLETRTLAQIQSDLINCKQGPREGVRTFANRIEQLLADLNDACIASEGDSSTSIVTSLNSKTALKAFTEGLHPSLKLIIKASRFNKLHEAIEAAVEEEKSFPQYSKNFNVKFNSKPKCSYCQKIGHSAANCYLKPGTSYARNFPPRKFEVKREPIQANNVRIVKCSYCKNLGHHISECRKRAYNNEKKNKNRNVIANREEENQGTSNPGNDERPGASGGATRAANLRQIN